MAVKILLVSGSNVHIKDLPDKLGKIKIGNSFYKAPGIYIIADELRKKGYQTDVIDHITFWTHEALDQFVDTHEYDVLGVSHVTLSTEIVQIVLDKFKKKSKNIKTIVGAFHPSYNKVISDYYVYGHSETAIHEIIKDIENENDKLIFTEYNSGKFVDATQSYPARLDFNYSFELYEEDDWKNNDIPSIETSRGCPFKCKFCSFPLIGMKKDTSIDMKRLEDQLKRNYEEFGIKHYITADDTFNSSSDKLANMAESVSKLSFKPTFSGFIRFDLLITKPEQKELLVGCNYIGHYYGIETFHRPSGQIIGKGMDPNRIKENLIDLDKYFSKYLDLYRMTISLIVGLPKQPEESILETQDWLFENLSHHHWNWIALMIEENAFYLSEFSKNYEKYGIRKIIKPIPKSETMAGSTGDGYNLVSWEHDIMNYDRALELGNFLNRQREGKSRLIGAWRSPYLAAGIINDDMTESEIESTLTSQLDIHNYILGRMML